MVVAVGHGHDPSHDPNRALSFVAVPYLFLLLVLDQFFPARAPGRSDLSPCPSYCGLYLSPSLDHGAFLDRGPFLVPVPVLCPAPPVLCLSLDPDLLEDPVPEVFLARRGILSALVLGLVHDRSRTLGATLLLNQPVSSRC